MQKSMIAAFALAVCLTAGLSVHAAAAPKLLTIGGAPLGGTYYPAALALADIIGKYVPETAARVEVTGGTMENPSLMQQGELQLALANVDVAYFAFHGEAPYKQPMPALRSLFVGLAPGVVQYAVLEESGIRSMRDLKGKRIAVGPQGNSSGLLFAKILQFYDIETTDVTRSFVSFADGVSELLDRHVDMAIVQAGLPAPGLQEAFASPRNVRILSFPQKERGALLQKYPYYIPVTIPKETYAKMNEDVTTLATRNMVLVHADVDSDTVYAVTKAVFEHLGELYAAHPSLRSVTLETASETPIPLHEGARRYFRERAVLK